MYVLSLLPLSFYSVEVKSCSICDFQCAQKHGHLEEPARIPRVVDPSSFDVDIQRTQSYQRLGTLCI